MYTTKIISLTFALWLLITMTWLAQRGLTENKQIAPTDANISFDTSQVTDRVWYGTASGGVSGNVTIQALNEPPQVFRGTWSGLTRWQVVAGSNSFVAEMDGKINTYNGVLMMRGRIVNGANPAAEVWAQGQVVSINPHRFVGTIRVIQP